jgi:hypothetical protein
VTEWQLPNVPDFDWAAEDRRQTREDWVAADGGYWVYPPAGTDLEPVWMADPHGGPFLAFVSSLLDVLPGIGSVKDVIQFFTGSDIITGEELSWLQRILGLAGAVFEATGGVVLGPAAASDLMMDYADVVQDSPDAARSVGDLVSGSAQMRDGADINRLEWTEQTTALLHVGQLEAQRLTEQLAAKHPMTPEQAAQVRELLVRAFVRQAQADGLLPQRLEVLPSPAEGGDPSETVDVRDPMTGTTWDVSDSLGVVTQPRP